MFYPEIMMKTFAFHYRKKTEHLFTRRAFFSSWLSLPFRSTCQKNSEANTLPMNIAMFRPLSIKQNGLPYHPNRLPRPVLLQWCSSWNENPLVIFVGLNLANLLGILFHFESLFTTYCYFTIPTETQFSPEVIETKLQKASATACPLRCPGRS